MRIGYCRLRSSGACSTRNSGDAARYDFRCFRKALEWSSARGFLYFRVTPALLPSAGKVASWEPWKHQLESLGASVRDCGVRLSIRPGSDIYLNTTSEDQYRRWASHLVCLAALLDMMNLDSTHKLQIEAEPEAGGMAPPHAKEADLIRLDERHRRLPEAVQRRLVVESSHCDSLRLWSLTGIPIVYRASSASVESLDAALSRYRQTWADEDGLPVVDLRWPDTPKIDYLLASAPDADYMLETETFPRSLARLETKIPYGFE